MGIFWLEVGSNKKVPYANTLAAGYLKGYLIHGKWNAGSAKFGIYVADKDRTNRTSMSEKLPINLSPFVTKKENL